jgi:hypothetical protein
MPNHTWPTGRLGLARTQYHISWAWHGPARKGRLPGGPAQGVSPRGPGTGPTSPGPARRLVRHVGPVYYACWTP